MYKEKVWRVFFYGLIPCYSCHHLY